VQFDPFLPRVSNAILCPGSLLCDRLVIPTVPRFRGINESLRRNWLEAGEALANDRASHALQILMSAADQTVASNVERCHFLFDAAHGFLAANSQTAADSCIQEGLSLLSGRSERSEGTFNGPLWLVMATSALLCKDLDGCSTVSASVRHNPAALAKHATLERRPVHH
jgi:hypothetical protein